ncbi:MAG TPA: RnfABCDGE type electron transport complex subunit D [Desulfobacteraceae bacterium]|nr:RnfABCDGE type electron transport complex subunit D [Desulfobacteraceae bacterium]
MKKPELHVSMPPHLHSGDSLKKMHLDVLAALVPAIFAGWFFFGWSALLIILLSAVTAMLTELLWQKAVGRPVRIGDGSALITGILLGLILTSENPWWIPILGAFIAILVGKQLFGGLGSHPFNSAIVGWAFLQISYKDILTNFPIPEPRFLLEAGEFLSDPALITLKDSGAEEIVDLPWKDLFLGNVPAEIGTACILAILIGGAYLLYRRRLTWHIPFSFIASAWIFALIFHQIDPETYASPTFHILSGWMLLGAFFLAPEKGTCPVTAPGMILYGIGCGVLTMIIRLWGSYTEGVPFAILLMNAATPLLDRIKPRTVGRIKEIA